MMMKSHKINSKEPSIKVKHYFHFYRIATLRNRNKMMFNVSLTINTWNINGQLDATDWFFIAQLIVRSTCFGHHYAHHQELKSYRDGCSLWYLALWFTGRWSGVELWVVSGLLDVWGETSRKPDT